MNRGEGRKRGETFEKKIRIDTTVYFYFRNIILILNYELRGRGRKKGRLAFLIYIYIVFLEQVRSAGGHMVKQRRFIGNTNNKMINIREYL